MTADSVLATRIVRGTLIGLVAGIAASFAMDRYQALVAPPQPSGGEPATQQAADGIARTATGAPLSPARKPLGGALIHYAVGAALGASYGLAAVVDPRVTRGFGTTFASATWVLLDEGAVPATGLGEAPWRAPPAAQVYGLASHLVFGIATEATRRLADRLLPAA